MKKKVIIISIIILALVGAGLYFFLPKKSGDLAPKWTYSTVTKGNLVQSITATGTIEPVTSVDVGTQVSGIVTTVYVDYNSVVKKGQIIAELDKSTLKLDLNNNKHSLAEAEAELAYQTSIFNRTKELKENKLISDAEYEEALYNFTKAGTAVESAKISVERSQINLGYATIYSPIDGVVLSKSIEEGQTVASSYSTPTLFNVAADLTDMRVIADVDEADIGNVREGQRVSFTVDAFTDDVFEGWVTQVRQEGTVESNVVTYEVVISAANPDLKLKPGLTASVEVFTLDEKCDAMVAQAALTFNPEDYKPSDAPTGPPAGRAGAKKGAFKKPTIKTGEQVIWVKDGDRIRPQTIVAGLSNGIHTAVSGVIEGDSVVVGAEINFTAGGRSASKSPFVQQRGPR